MDRGVLQAAMASAFRWMLACKEGCLQRKHRSCLSRCCGGVGLGMPLKTRKGPTVVHLDVFIAPLVANEFMTQPLLYMIVWSFPVKICLCSMRSLSVDHEYGAARLSEHLHYAHPGASSQAQATL